MSQTVLGQDEGRKFMVRMPSIQFMIANVSYTSLENRSIIVLDPTLALFI